MAFPSGWKDGPGIILFRCWCGWGTSERRTGSARGFLARIRCRVAAHEKEHEAVGFLVALNFWRRVHSDATSAPPSR